MKKLKLLPTILMLALCVGILAIGIYAVKPTENNISGSITVNASNAEVKLELLQNGAVTQTFESVRGGATFQELDLEFDVETANSLSEVEDISYTVRITNKSTTPLGAYFFDPTSTLPDDGYAVGANVLNTSQINTNGESPVKMADVVLTGYSYIPANSAKAIELDVTMTLSQFFDTTVTGDFDYTLNIEPYKGSDNFHYQDQPGYLAYVRNGESLVKFPETIYDTDMNYDRPLGDIDGSSCGIYGYTMAKNVVVPSCYTSISASSFNGCTGMVYIDLQSTNIKTINASTFKNCTSLNEIKFQSTLENIEVSAFEGCDSLKLYDITICDGGVVLKNGDCIFTTTNGTTATDLIEFRNVFFALEYFVNKTKRVILDEGITTIKNNTFAVNYSSSFYNLKEIVLPTTLSNVETFAFYVGGEDYFFAGTGDRLSVKGELSGTDWSFKDGSIAITGTTFSGLGDMQGLGALVMEDINLPSGLTSIESDAFRGIASVKNVILPDGLLSIGDKAFDACLCLTRIFIPKSVTTVGANIYGGWDSTTFYCEAAEKPNGWDSAWSTSGSGPNTGIEVYTTSWGVARPDWAK